ncbi:MAG: ATP-binding cassette domain-containing protein [Legionellaceae bacterium]|nr:ATP-binding cassette domain-containing protein [Legionellaceae bacterium]
MPQAIIQIQGLKNFLGNQWVHKDVNLTVNQGEIVAIIGGSGSGKTTILRNILMLLTPTEGSVEVFGQEVTALNPREANLLRKRWGMLFQHSALFSGMSVLDNIMFPLQESTRLPPHFLQALGMLKLGLVGLPTHAADKLPSELSGGMQRRAAAARAIAMDPELLFLDEPTTGLDPHSARQFDELILFLRDALGLTIVMISHDIHSLERTADKIIFLGEGRVLADGDFHTVRQNPHPLIVDYFKNTAEII